MPPKSLSAPSGNGARALTASARAVAGPRAEGMGGTQPVAEGR